MQNEINLQNTPRPHYLQTGKLSKSGNKILFLGTAFFSHEDVTLSDRGHVNVTHIMFSIWNVAHIAVREKLLYPKMRIVTQSGSYFEDVSMNTNVDLCVSIEILKESESRMKCIASATLQDNEGKTLSSSNIVFIAKT